MICNIHNVNHVRFRLFEPGEQTKSGIDRFRTAGIWWDGWYHQDSGSCYLEQQQISLMVGNPPGHFEQWVSNIGTDHNTDRQAIYDREGSLNLYDLSWAMRYFTHCRNEGNPQALSLLYHLNIPDLPTLIKQHA